MKTAIISLLIGAFSGLIAALCGVGGGIVMIPAFRSILTLGHKQSLATSLAVIVPTALIATIRNATGKTPLVDWWVAIPTAVGATLVVWFAIPLMKSASNEVLVRIFGVLLLVAGAKLLIKG